MIDLNSDQEENLVEDVASGRFRTPGEIADWVESKYGVKFKGNSIYSVLQRLGCSPKVPRSRHEKAVTFRHCLKTMRPHQAETV